MNTATHFASGPAEGGLLTIKEAAAMLRVSEVSLRRWTEQGVLPCLRVGGRRERRFRMADLQAYARAASASRVDRQGAARAIHLQGLEIARGEHLCALYDSAEGRDKLAVPFLAEGLACNERCYLIADDIVREDLLARLLQTGVEVAALRARGTLVCRTPQAPPSRTLAFFRGAFADAVAAGCDGLRVLGDMAGFISAGAELEDLVAFEAEYDRSLAHKYPVVSLCQYDARVFSGVGVLRALEVHGDIERHPLRCFLGA